MSYIVIRFPREEVSTNLLTPDRLARIRAALDAVDTVELVPWPIDDR